jgi:hypothetical protein
MRQLAGVQVFTWLGLFAMWLYFPVAVAHHVYGANDPASPAYAEGVAWGGLCFSAYSVVCFLTSAVLPAMARKLGKRLTHVLCLACGAAGLLGVAAVHSPWGLLLPMAGVGIAWASILSMPYALLADVLPKARIGTYMGLFNAFIVLPILIERAKALLQKRGLLTPSVVAVALLTLRDQPAKAKEFWDGVAMDDGLRRGDPRHTLVKTLRDRPLRGSHSEGGRIASTAWNAYYSNRELTFIRIVILDVKINGVRRSK